MKEKPRAQNSGRFEKEFTNEDFIKAVQACMEEATCTASEVAEKLGCNSRYAKNRLIELSKNGEIEKKMKGKTWGFKPKKPN